MSGRTRVSISLPQGLVENLDRRQAACGQSRSEFIRRAVQRLLDEERERELWTERAREIDEIDEQYVRSYRERPQEEDMVPWPDQKRANSVQDASWEDSVDDEARGSVVGPNLPPPWGRRPVVLLTRSDAYGVLTWIVAAPLTPPIRHIRLSVPLDPGLDRVPRSCAVTLDNMMAVHAGWIDDFVTELRRETMLAIDEAIHFTLGLAH